MFLRKTSAAQAAILVLLLVAGRPAAARANAESAALRAQASKELYNLDRERALETFRKAVAADPRDAAAHRGLASALWLSVTFRRGNMTVDDYLGGVTRRKTPFPPPPAETVNAFNESLGRALALARERVAANPRDADAHYEVGAAMGLRASYTATVESSALSAFKAAREAYDEHEKVLELDSARKDAGLIVGTYRYIVASLSLPLRWAAYVVGFGGGREQGLHLIEGAASYVGDNQEEARFTLVVLYNREKQFDAALSQLAMLRERYPANRLAWLESGSTSLRAGKTADAERFLDEGLRRFAGDSRPRMFGEDALWSLKRGTARASLGRDADARADLDKALAAEGRDWVHGRAHLELGKLDLKAGHRPAANEHFQQAARLCENDNDESTAVEARRLTR
jgi:tetratricopeptide (TPR) repeat protein